MTWSLLVYSIAQAIEFFTTSWPYVLRYQEPIFFVQGGLRLLYDRQQYLVNIVRREFSGYREFVGTLHRLVQIAASPRQSIPIFSVKRAEFVDEVKPLLGIEFEYSATAQRI